MLVLLLLVLGAVYGCLLLVVSVRPERPTFSRSELMRRAKLSPAYKKQLERLDVLEHVEVLQRLLTGMLLVAVVALCVVACGWSGGLFLAIVAVVAYPTLARSKLVHRGAQSLYGQLEPRILRLVIRGKTVFHALRSAPLSVTCEVERVDSHEELAEIIANSHEVLSEPQRRRVQAALAFDDKTVASVMTPRSVIDSIKKGEFLGPLVLDELHALGHSRLPVIDGDLDHVVGILQLNTLLSLDTKRSTATEKAMDPKVFYIHQDDTLQHALAAFLKLHHHLFIVINDERETVGLLSLEDVVEALIGQRIVDEDDIHADLRAVARRQGQHTNNPPGHVDV